MSQTIILKHSTVKDKLPSSAQYGEVFVNYHSENPFLATLNNQGQFEKFLSENKLNELYYNKSQVNDIIANIESGGTIDFDDYYKKNEVDTLLQGKSDTAHTHDYSQILNTPDLSNFATLSDIPSINGLASEVWVGENYQPKGNYLTEHQSLENYYTKSEADGKFLTSHQDLSGYVQKSDLDDYLTIASASTIYATKEELEEHIPTVDAYTKAETDTLLAGKASSSHTHNYETLTNKPDLSIYLTEHQDISGLATKQELEDYQMKSGMTSYLTIAQAEQDLQPKGDYALKSELPDTSNFITSGFTEDHYQPKGTYVVPSDLNNYVTSGYAEETFAKKGDVPTDVYTKSETDTLLAGKASSSHTHDYSEILNTPDVPKIWKGTVAEYTNLTEIDNDTLYVITDESEQFVTSGDVESMISGYTNLTEVQTLLEGYSTTSHTHDYSEIENTPDLSGFASLSDIPDTSNFITSAFTEDHYQPKGTYVAPSDLDSYAEKSDLANYQPVSGMSDYVTDSELNTALEGYSSTAHTHSYNDLEDKPTIPSIAGLASEEWVSNNFSSTAHTHSQYLTETSADSRYARVVSCTQAEYDALVQNDQVEQGVLYCITESN